MKNKIVLFASFLLVGFGALASTTNNTSITNNYNNGYEQSFTFVERGVTFTVFQNGEFDFYINPRNDVHVGYRGNGLNISFNSGYNYDAYVQYDNYGAIIQVEDIPIYYDYYGRVDGIGNIDINYNYGRLVSIGRMYIHYNTRGYYTNTSGYINSHNRNYVQHSFHKYFVRPLFNYRIVSYLPYRNHYKPTRYTYYKDHSKNKYYSTNNKNNNKRTTNSKTVKRVASNNVPKRTIDRVAKVSKTNNTRDYSAPRTDRTSTSRTNTSTRNNTVNSSTRSKTTTSKTNTRTVTKKPVVKKQTPVKRKSSRN